MRRLALTLAAALLLASGCSDGGEATVAEPTDAVTPTDQVDPADDPEADDPESDDPGPAVGQPPADDEGVTPGGALDMGATRSCMEDYSPAAVAGRAFSFAGTVTEIGDPVTDRGDSGDLGYAGVTFRVEEWFGPGTGPSTFTVDLGAPTKSRMSESAPSYGVGSALLVSGEDRWGAGGLADPIAWGCGFTRYFDEETAADWRSAS